MCNTQDTQELAVSKFLSLEDGKAMWNYPDQHGNTPIMMAAKYASRDVITLLLNNEEISLEAVDNLGRELCSMIRCSGEREIPPSVKLIIAERAGGCHRRKKWKWKTSSGMKN